MLDELYVHHLLARRYRVEYEEGSGRQPAFCLYDNDGQYVGRVEVLTLLQRQDWDAEELRHGQLVEQINQRLPLTTHSVVLDIERWTDAPSIKHLVAWLTSTIEDLRNQPSTHPADAGGPVRTYTGRSAEIRFEFLPLPPGYPVTADDAVVVGGACTGGLIDTAARLRDRLDTKASK
ncbi:hypothetical protein ACFPIJ_29465 [Dactylosporangium cerinum]|uniref:DUF2283 domain-containing protein n=1 Tax=Dactylosporangium cerinum TaxID=1434730 RepID=A0ABV9VZW9_9ACTN